MSNVEVEPKTIDELVRRWIDEIDTSRNNEKDWRKEGLECEELYEASKDAETTFNVLYSNTETLAPSLYGAVPRPVVQRRFKDDDPLGKAVSLAGQRVLEFLIDTNSDEYETFDDSIKDAVQDALLPGRGVTEFCYHADTYGAEGESQLLSECVYPKSAVWSRFYHGYAKRWSDVAWCAIEMYLDQDAVEKEFGKAIADKMQYSYEGDKDEDKKQDGRKDSGNKTKTKTCCIYKIWDKKKREILWVSPNHPTSILRTDEDELKLTGFYPFTRPIRLMRKANNLMPTTLYKLYRTQARELNILSARLIHLLKACKVRGVYDSTIGEIEEVLKSEDAGLVPAENCAALQNTKGLEGAIWLMPIDKIIAVIKELYMAREQCKQVIYEITGISDIIRGQTNASETLGAQKIKENWVTLRLKNMQKEVQRYVRDSLRIMLEIAAKRFQQSTWKAMTGLPYLTDEEYAQLQQIMAGAQQAGQQPDPQTMEKMQQPRWSQVLGVMQDDMQRAYKIDIETNSTLDVEASQDKEMIAELMNAIAQFLNGVAPLVEQGILPFQAAQAMLLAITRKFRFGTEIEDYIKAMQEPKPKDDGTQQKALLDAQQKEKDRALQAQTEGQKAAQAKEDAQLNHQQKMADLHVTQQGDVQKIAAEEAADIRRIAAEREAKLAELAAQRETSRMEAKLSQETELKKAELARQTAIDVARINAEAKLESERRSAEAEKQKNDQVAAVEKDKNDQATAIQMDAQEKQHTQAQEATKTESKSMEKMFTLLAQMMEQQQSLLETLASEKEVVRDDKGKVSGMRVKPSGTGKPH